MLLARRKRQLPLSGHPEQQSPEERHGYCCGTLRVSCRRGPTRFKFLYSSRYRPRRQRARCPGCAVKSMICPILSTKTSSHLGPRFLRQRLDLGRGEDLPKPAYLIFKSCPSSLRGDSPTLRAHRLDGRKSFCRCRTLTLLGLKKLF